MRKHIQGFFYYNAFPDLPSSGLLPKRWLLFNYWRLGTAYQPREYGTGFSEKSVADYHSKIRNTQEERRTHSLRGGSLKSRVLGCPVGRNWSDRVSNYPHWLRLPQITWSLKFSRAQCIKNKREIDLFFSSEIENF